MSRKCKKVASLANISEEILSFTIRWKVYLIIAGIEKYKLIIKKKKKHYEIALLAKTNLDYIKNLISWSLTASYIERDYFD